MTTAELREARALRAALRERAFFGLLSAASIPLPEKEYRFVPERRWRFDFAWPGKFIALEVEGGVFTMGRHTRGAGYMKDLAKYSEAAVRGWRVIRVVPTRLAKTETITLLQRAFEVQV